MLTATGTFEVKMLPEASQEPDGFGAGTARFGLAKSFTGEVSGEAVGTMLSVGAPLAGSAAAYVAVDRFARSVNGKTGGFILIHRGTVSKAGNSDLEIIIAPDSGTGELDGIVGTLLIDVKAGVHNYTLTYELLSGLGK